MSDEAPKAMGIAWYTPSSFRELAAIPEAEVLKSYSDYVDDAERMIAKLEAQGIRAIKVPVDVPLMVAWCRKYGYQPNLRARSIFGMVMEFARASGEDVMTVPFEDRGRSLQ